MHFKRLERLLQKPIGISPRRSQSKPFTRKNNSKIIEPKQESYFVKYYATTTKANGMGKSQIESYIHDRKLQKYRDKPFGLLNQSGEDRLRIEKRTLELERRNPMMYKSTITDLQNYGDALQKLSKPKLRQQSKSPTKKKETQVSKIRSMKPMTIDTDLREIKESVSTLETPGKLEKYKNITFFQDLCKRTEAEDFEFLKKIGSGKFSDVYMVRDRKSSFIAALKIIRKSQLNSVKMVNQFVRQIKIHSHVKHPNIVNLYSAFFDDGNVYLLQQFCNGGQLYNKLKKIGKFSQKTVSFIIRNILNAVSYLHSKDILHRDIKPENIILVHGTVKICDFGWAVYQPNKLRETLCGTPIYTCPELVKGQKYSDKIDLWTIGMLTYELYFGHIPFKIEQQQDLAKIATDQITFPSNSKLSPELQDFVLQLLKKDPRERLTADILLSHPFIEKYKKVEVCEELYF